MENEKKTLRYIRLQKEFQMSTYTVEEVEPFHYILRATIEEIPIVLDIKIPEKYPFKAPKVIVLSPKGFLFNASDYWSPSSKLSNIFNLVSKKMKEYKKPENINVPPSIRGVIDLAKRTEKPISLVLGSRPGENPDGRTFYSNPQIFLLNIAAGKGNISRFFQIDFTNLQQMNWLCKELPGAFEKIILETSTMKFFTPISNIQSQFVFLDILTCIYRLLTDTGVFYIADPAMTPGGLARVKFINQNGKKVMVPNNTPYPGQIMKEMVESVGFQAEYKDIDSLTDPIVQLVHKDRKPSGGSTNFLVATKPKKGGRRKTLRKKMNKTKKNRRR